MKNTIATLLMLASTVFAVDLEPLLTIGTPVAGRKEAWQGHVNFVTWLNVDTLAYVGESGFVKCYNLAKRSESWSKTIGGKIRQVTAGKGFLFLLDEDGTVHILTGSTGERVKQLDREAIAAIVGADFLIPTYIAWVPGRNALLVSTYSKEYGDNSFLLGGKSFKLLGKVKSDGGVSDVRPTRDGSLILTLSHANNIRIWSIDQTREVFKMGEDKVAAIDAPFMSKGMFDGNKTLVYSIDNSWATGTVHVFDIHRKKENASFDSRNGHLEMDVDFKTSRIALTGTSKNLTLVDFSGRVLAERKNAADQRVVAVSFSPDAKRLALGSWDNTVRIFEVKEERTPTNASTATNQPALRTD
jgi:WD40 repeat protein